MEKLPEKYSDESVIVFKNNPQIAYLFALQIATKNSLWNKITEKDKEEALKNISDVLQKIPTGMNTSSIEKIRKNISLAIERAIREPRTILLFFTYPPQYCINFAEYSNESLSTRNIQSLIDNDIWINAAMKIIFFLPERID